MQVPLLTPDRLFYLKRIANTPEGIDSEHPGYNIQVVPLDPFQAYDQILFRDYLRSHAEKAAEYARLKCDIVGRITDYREYTPPKVDFIQRVLADARAERR